MGTKHNSSEGEAEARKIVSLRKRVRQARQVHRIADDPYLKVVELDRLRASITGSLWFFLAVGLGYTTVGVHDFIAAGLTVADPMWWGAWAVEPALAGMLITVLRWESAMLIRRIPIESGWVSLTKWGLLASTLLMNILSAWGGLVVEIVLHIAIPGLVFCLAEVMPVVQDRFGRARAKLLAEIAQADAEARETEQREHGQSAASPPSTVADLQSELGAHAQSPAPVSPTLPPVTTAASEPTPPTTVRPPKLAAGLLAQIESRAVVIAASGRTITAADVQEVIKLPASMAEQAARYFAAAHTPA